MRRVLFPMAARSAVTDRQGRNERQRIVQSLLAAQDGAERYVAMAAIESDPRQAAVYRRLAASELDRADSWRDRLRAADLAGTKPGLSLWDHALLRLARWFGRVPTARPSHGPFDRNQKTPRSVG